MAFKDARRDVQLQDLIRPLAEARDCLQHPGNPQKVFCETCAIQMCLECQFVEHKDHNTKSTKDVISGLRNELASYEPELLELEANASEDVKEIAKDRASLQEHQKQEVEALRKRHRAEMQQLDDKEALAQEKVDSLKSLSSDVFVAVAGSDVVPMLDVRTQVQEAVKKPGGSTSQIQPKEPNDKLKIRASTDSSSEPTIWGIEGDDVAELNKCLAAGANPDERRRSSESNGTALMDYCYTARPRLLRRLCSVTDVNLTESSGYTALHCVVGAAYYGIYTRGLEQRVTEAVEVLLAAGADASLKDDDGRTPRERSIFLRQECRCSRETDRLLKKLETTLEKKKRARFFTA